MGAKTSVIICAYTEERWEDLLAAVRSVREQSTPPDEIILVIDHNPGMFQRARQSFPDLIVTENLEARGLSGGRNTGIAAASGGVIAFLDDDAQADPTWLETLFQVYQDPAVMGSGGKINPAWQTGKPGWFPPEFNWVVGCSYLGLPEVQAPVRNMIGCNMSFRREVFAVGGFTHGIGRVGKLAVGCEETELCIRAQQRWPERLILYVPQAQVNHLVPASRSTFAYFRSRCYAEGLSKALVARLAGAKSGLSSEWAYTLKTLPLGFLRGVGDALRHGDLSGLGRAGAILAGLFFTTAGFLITRLSGAANRIPLGTHSQIIPNNKTVETVNS